MTFKAITSKEGFNAVSESDPDNLDYSSEYNTLKYYKSGYADVTYNPGSSPLTFTRTRVAHGLGYTPFFYCYVDLESTGTFIPCPYLMSFIGMIRSYYAYADDTYITFVCAMNGGAAGAKTAKFRYFIFRNELDFS